MSRLESILWRCLVLLAILIPVAAIAETVTSTIAQPTVIVEQASAPIWRELVDVAMVPLAIWALTLLRDVVKANVTSKKISGILQRFTWFVQEEVLREKQTGAGDAGGVKKERVIRRVEEEFTPDELKTIATKPAEVVDSAIEAAVYRANQTQKAIDVGAVNASATADLFARSSLPPELR